MAETAPKEIEQGGILPLDERRPFLDHLEELRRRLLRCFLWTGLGMATAWRAAPQILEVLIRPVGQVVFLSPAEPFLVHLKAAFLGGLVLSCPLLVWEVWGFFRPALPARGRSVILVLLPLSVGLFLLGAWFGWQWLLPSALKILLPFGGGVMQPMLTVNSTIGFASWLIIGCGLIFQLPLAVFFLAVAGLVRPAALLRHWRLVLVAILITAAMLTPTPDIFTQLLLAGPLAVLYLLSVLLAFGVSFFSHGRVADAAAGEG